MKLFEKYMQKAKVFNENLPEGNIEIDMGDEEESNDFNSKISNEKYFDKSVEFFFKATRGGKTLNNVTGNILKFLQTILSDEEISEKVNVDMLLDKLPRIIRKEEENIVSDDESME